MHAAARAVGSPFRHLSGACGPSGPAPDQSPSSAGRGTAPLPVACSVAPSPPLAPAPTSPLSSAVGVPPPRSLPSPRVLPPAPFRPPPLLTILSLSPSSNSP
eukprot:5426289-Pleurochrysis_carterae.AAC.1